MPIEHQRIPPTLVYARSQRNNHLLVEAAGLLTAGMILPDHPKAEQWRALGWKWFTRGLKDQIDGYGEYSQHSTNYHRLMLQVVLWVNMLIRSNDLSRSDRSNDSASRSIPAAAARMVDDTTPGLHNDGRAVERAGSGRPANRHTRTGIEGDRVCFAKDET